VGSDDQDPLFLQSKEADASVLERFIGKSVHRHHGRRVVVGQRLMQAASDIFLGWLRVKGIDGRTRDYYIRQLHDWKGGAEVENLLVPGATLYTRLCAVTLARARALGRSDRHRLLSGQGQRVRPVDHGLRNRVCRPERTRLRSVHRGRRLGTAHGADRSLKTGPASRSRK
jgi:hypothetical protein